MTTNSKRINFLSIPIDAITMEETLARVEQAIQNGGQIHHTVVNAGKVVLMQDDKELFNSVVSSDLINADGQAVVWGARLLGKKIPERVAGIDLMERLIERAHARKHKIFLLGATEEVISKVVEHYKKIYSSEFIAGYRNGYFNKDEEIEIAKQIGASGAQLLFVAISSPKKENFLYRFKDELKKVNFIMGVGGSFDVVSGKTKRAPRGMQKIGLEWLYRLYQEPLRMWERYTIGNARFILLVAKGLFTKR
jgi:N-acetylglucosaminyldiphosphoundecaprenol N-acetyl-beta-D-mannosaminyltransferase